jgi:hypothetical protein
VAITPAHDIRIWADEKGYITHSARKGSPADLVGSWLTSDVQGSGHSLVRLLDDIEARRSERTERPLELSGNAWIAVITKDQVGIENQYNESLNGTVPLDYVLQVLRAYWDALGEKEIQAGKDTFAKDENREPSLPW